MSIQSNIGKWCAGALLLVASNIGFAESFQDRLFVDGSYGMGVIDPGDNSIDVEKYSLGGGLEISDELYVEGSYSGVDFDGVESDLFQASLGYSYQADRDLTAYGTAGIAQWDSSDIDKTETGFGLGVGVILGGGQLSFKAGYEYFGSLDSDPVFEDVHVVSIGLRYHLTEPQRGRLKAANGALYDATACKQEHKGLFFLCDQENEQEQP